MSKFDNYEIHPLINLGSDIWEQATEEEAEAHEKEHGSNSVKWAIFGHITGEGLELIGHYDSKRWAFYLYELITGELKKVDHNESLDIQEQSIQDVQEALEAQEQEQEEEEDDTKRWVLYAFRERAYDYDVIDSEALDKKGLQMLIAALEILNPDNEEDEKQKGYLISTIQHLMDCK